MEVHALFAACYQQGGGRIGGLEEWWSSISEDAEFDPALIFLARDSNGEIIGVAHCWTSSFVKDLAVSLSHRRQGIGTALMRHVFDHFQRRGFEAVDLKVEIHNPSGAERLYRHLGMEPVLD
ncbi:GNAT family N-acetyltransferase [Sphingobium nicotianae]